MREVVGSIARRYIEVIGRALGGSSANRRGTGLGVGHEQVHMEQVAATERPV